MKGVPMPMFNNKSDVQSYSSYRGIKLMSHTKKNFAESSGSQAKRRRDDL